MDSHNDTRQGRSRLKRGPDRLGKSRFSLAQIDPALRDLVAKTQHTTLAVWAADCAERVIPYFEEAHPQDGRPRQAVEACRAWVRTGVFKMADIRGASLASHAAAREVGEENAARSAARAAGQAVATAHVPAHSLAAASYALQAIHRASDTSGADAAVAEERHWQYRHLLELSRAHDTQEERQ